MSSEPDAAPNGEKQEPILQTRWSQILRARDPNDPRYEEAWEFLIRTYRPVIRAKISLSFWNQSDADELVAEFESMVLFQKVVPNAVPGKDLRFRTYLAVNLRNFIVETWRHRLAAKRGGKAEHVSIEDVLEQVPDGSLREDEFFRSFYKGVARRAYDRAIERARATHRGGGHEEEFNWVMGVGKGAESDAEIAQKLGIEAGTVKKRRFDCRQRISATFAEEVAELVEPGEGANERCFLEGLL